MKKTKLRRLGVMAVMLLILPFVCDAQLLKGKVEGAIQDLQVAISLDGDQGGIEYKPVELQDDGTFEFDAVLTSSFNDVMIFVNDSEIVGAHLERGKTLELTLSQGDEGGLKYAFEGDNTALSDFYTRFARAFDFMRYFPMDAPGDDDNTRYFVLLENEKKAITALLPSISNAGLRHYYTSMTEATAKCIRIRLLMNDTEKEEEYHSLVTSIDVNDEINMKSGLSGMFIHYKIPDELLAYGGDMTPWTLAYMDTVDYYVTNSVVKKALVRECAIMYFNFGKGGDYMKFWEAFRRFAKDYPDIIQAYEGKIIAMNKTAKGTDAIDATLQTPDGKTCRLSDFFGKFTYIDVWATWCGPCCAEIPYLEKLAAHFKGDDRIQFISLSVDSDRKAWLDKLGKDRPEWLQFMLSRDEAKRFMEAWGISGIPRFIMISKDGKIFAADAPRPSDENIISSLEAALTDDK